MFALWRLVPYGIWKRATWTKLENWMMIIKMNVDENRIFFIKHTFEGLDLYLPDLVCVWIATVHWFWIRKAVAHASLKSNWIIIITETHFNSDSRHPQNKHSNKIFELFLEIFFLLFNFFFLCSYRFRMLIQMNCL